VVEGGDVDRGTQWRHRRSSPELRRSAYGAIGATTSSGKWCGRGRRPHLGFDRR
jgi:hypothetical protein